MVLSWQQIATRPSEVPSFVTVRTVSVGEESVDSMPAPLGQVTEELQRLSNTNVQSHVDSQQQQQQQQQPTLLKPQPTYPNVASDAAPPGGHMSRLSAYQNYANVPSLSSLTPTSMQNRPSHHPQQSTTCTTTSTTSSTPLLSSLYAGASSTQFSQTSKTTTTATTAITTKPTYVSSTAAGFSSSTIQR